MTRLDVANIVVAAVYGIAGFTYWPFDWRGRRRQVTLKRSRRPWQ